MNPPRTPGRSIKHVNDDFGQHSSSTSAASPFTPSDQDSPRVRASTLAYGGRSRAYSPLTVPGDASPQVNKPANAKLQPPLRTDYDFVPSSPPTPRAPSAPKMAVSAGSTDSFKGDVLAEGALAVPRTPSRSTPRTHTRIPSSASAHQRTPSASAHARNSVTRTASGHHPRKVQKRTSIGPWEFVKSIGAGSMGQVKLAIHRYTRQPAAVKIVPKAFTQKSRDGRESNESKDARVIREAAIGRLLYHPNISKLYDVYSMTGHFYLVFEYINGGQMLDYIIAHGCVKEAQARRFARSICSALDYCHQNSIVHRDLKIENILIAENGDVKLIDFGLSNMFRRQDLLKTFCGSLYFAAPELLNALPYTGPEIDVWSFGVVLYVLVCGKVPFEDKSMTVLHSKIKKGQVEYPTWLSSQCVDLLRKMLKVNPEERASLFDVCNHPWMMKGFDGPPESLVPKRMPLTLDSLDPTVLDEMEKLGIGEAGQIELTLRQVLSSADYKRAVDLWYDAQQYDLSMPRRMHSVSMMNPVNSFSPEISCYFLTRERMERIPPQQQQLAQQQQQFLQQQQQQQRYQQQLQQPYPSVSIMPATKKNDDGELQVRRTRARTVGSEYGEQIHSELPQSAPVTPELQGTLQIPQPAFVSNVMQQAQVGVITPINAVKSIEITPHGTVQVPEEFKAPPQRVVSQPLPARISSTGSDMPNYSNSQALNSPKTQTQQMLQLQQLTQQQHQHQQLTQQPMSLFRKFSLRRTKPSAGHIRAKSTNHAQEIQSRPYEEIPPAGMPSIESPKQIFFRGIFSVQTTSTKPLREIREEILRVLNLKRIEYVEVKGGFACVARPYHIRRQPSSANGHRVSSGSSGAGNTSLDDPLRTPNKHVADYSFGSISVSPSTSPSTPRAQQHHRKVSENGVLSPTGSIGGSLESIDMEIGASDMLGNDNQKSSIPVRFEIDIVRVPIVSLHGIQFKKMTGNVWMYKNIAQEIIEELRI